MNKFIRVLKLVLKFALKIIMLIIPVIALCYANRIIKKSEGDSLDDINISNISLQKLESQYKNTLEVKASLEDKAKNSVFSLTIVITLIFSIIGFGVDTLLLLPLIIKIIVAILICLCLIYFLMSGIINLYLLTGKLQMYFITWEDDCYDCDEENKKLYIIDIIERNTNLNLIRNNFLSCSFRCVVIGILLLTVAFLIVYIYLSISPTQGTI